MRIEVVTVGDELLLGYTIDTNAAHLGRELATIGVEIVRRTTCGDSAESIASAVRDALDRSDGVITTGGLGPTSDDRTKQSIAALFGRVHGYQFAQHRALQVRRISPDGLASEQSLGIAISEGLNHGQE